VFLKRVVVGEIHMQAVDRVHYRHRLHLGEVLCGQSPFAGPDQLHCQSLEDDLCQFFAYAAPHATAERHVAEPSRPTLLPVRAEPVRVKQLRVLEGRGGLVSVPDAVHYTPSFGDLVAL